ncbi:MAG: DUF2818 family protein [Betaproteobacteria bacterium]|nr:DUF2818 family protein [Betaproteobacteria bacterium]
MNVSGAAVLWLAIGLFLANLPFVSSRRFGLVKSAHKSIWFRLLEWLAGYVLTVLVGFLLEDSVGSVKSQTWNFYAMTLLLFVVMAYPGFVFRYLRRSRPSD